MSDPCKDKYPDVYDRDFFDQEKAWLKANENSFNYIVTVNGKVPDESDPLYQRYKERKRALDAKQRGQVLLYDAVRRLVVKRFRDLSTSAVPLAASNFPADVDVSAAPDTLKQLEEQKLFFLAVHGLVQASGYPDPTMNRDVSARPGPGDELVNDKGLNYTIALAFINAVADAVKEFNVNDGLFRRVYTVIKSDSTTGTGAKTVTTLYSRQLAEVGRRLIEDRVDQNDPQLDIRIRTALSMVVGGDTRGRPAGIDISLPDLEAGSAVEIIPDNVRALAAIYFSSQLEELKFLQVADRVSDHFMNNVVPLGRGLGGERVFRYLKNASSRFTEIERRGFYGRAFGLAQGDARAFGLQSDAQENFVNRDFQDLWIRFLSAVSLYNRQAKEEKLLVSDEQALKAARDLAVNLSLHGFGVAHFAAVELQELVREVKEMLSTPEVVAAYGVRDVWQLVDRISTMYLGGAVNGVRYRTTAQAGGEIILWLADNASVLSSVSVRIGSGALFRDARLVTNVERWLAVTGTADDTVNKYSEPTDMKQQPSIPSMPSQMMVPDSIRNALNQVSGSIQMPSMPNPATAQA